VRKCICWTYVTFLGMYISLGMVLLDHMAVLILVFLRKLNAFFLSGCMSLHSHQQYMRFPFSPHLQQHLLLFVLVVVLTVVRWNLTVSFAFFCSQGWRLFFHVFFSHLNFFLWKSFAQFICPFLFSLIFLGSLVFWTPYMFWLSIPCQVDSWKIFSHSVGSLFNLEIISFVVRKLYNIM
jgi:hypothetical protein